LKIEIPAELENLILACHIKKQHLDQKFGKSFETYVIELLESSVVDEMAYLQDKWAQRITDKDLFMAQTGAEY